MNATLLSRPDLTPAQKVVYAALVDAVENNRRPSLDELSRACALTSKTAYRAVYALEQVGLIHCDRSEYVNRYSLVAAA